MKVAIDTGSLISGHKVRGVGFYTKNLIEALGDKVSAVDFGKADLDKYDVVHLPFFNPFFINIPMTSSKDDISGFLKSVINVKPKIVVTIHDLIPLIYPKHYPPGIKGSIKLLVNKILLKKVSAVITDTQASKKDIVRLLDIPEKKVYPIHLAPGKEFRKLNSKDISVVKQKYNLPDRFVLYLGDVNYNKNIPGLINACKIAKLPLVIVGKQAVEIDDQDLSHPELRHLRNLDWSKVARPGFVSDEDLVAIFNLASVYCQASFYEGFGFPILQAMACGIPVVAARTQALVEIGESACLFADPRNPKDMAEKINRAVKDETLRGQLMNTGHILVKKYSWARTAKETFEVYKRV